MAIRWTTQAVHRDNKCYQTENIGEYWVGAERVERRMAPIKNLGRDRTFKLLESSVQERSSLEKPNKT